MVDQSYLVAKPPPPSREKRCFDQEVLPAVIDLTGGFEVGLQRVAVATRTRPAVILGAGLVLGAAAATLLVRSMRPPRRRRYRF